MVDPEDEEGCAAIMDSIENRWQKADQELFIAAVILNPFFRTSTFAPLPFLNNAGIHSLLRSLWIRFYSTQPPPEFHAQVTDYLNGTGFFQNLQMQCGIVQVAADRLVSLTLFFISVHSMLTKVLQNESPDPLQVYADFCFSGREPPPFILLARRILSICANSASCERLFSVFGTTLTKLRNRLGTTTLNALSELKMHIRDEHLRKQTRKRLKRVFATRNETVQTPSTNPIPSTSTTTAMTTPALLPTDPTSSNDHGGSPAPASNAEPPSTGFRAIVQHHSDMVDDDNLDDEPVRASSVIGRQVPIRELFDFSRSHWVEMYAKSAKRSFDEELELYELLDLDAQGEVDVDLDVDDSTGAMLHG